MDKDTATKAGLRLRNKGIRRVRVADLEDAPWNFRTHPAAQKAALGGVIEELGFYGYPDVYETTSGTLRICDGHLRKALLVGQYGANAEIDVNVTDFDEAEAKKATLTKDPLAAMAQADKGQLDSLLREVQTGNEALAAMLTDLAKDNGILAGMGEVVEDEVPEPPAEPVTKPGDLYILGEHRLLCGDSTKAEDVDRLFAGGRASLLFTSPPYGQQRDYGAAKALVQDWDGLMRGVFQHAASVLEPDGQILVNLGLIHRDGEWIPYWDGWIAWMREQGWRRFGWYVWDQQRGLPGDWNGRLAPSHEFIFHFNKSAVRPDKHIECNQERAKKEREQIAKGSIKTGLRSKDGEVCQVTSPKAIGQTHKVPDSVWRFERHMANDIARKNHPATFPVKFAAHALASWPGLAFEPFCGSGTTIVAAEQLNRRCYAMELDPAYCDVAVQRWETITSKKAEVQHGT